MFFKFWSVSVDWADSNGNMSPHVIYAVLIKEEDYFWVRSTRLMVNCMSKSCRMHHWRMGSTRCRMQDCCREEDHMLLAFTTWSSSIDIEMKEKVYTKRRWVSFYVGFVCGRGGTSLSRCGSLKISYPIERWSHDRHLACEWRAPRLRGAYTITSHGWRGNC